MNRPDGEDFSGKQLVDAVFRGRNLAGQRFVGAVLDGADFSEAILEHTDFSNASLIGTNFASANLDGANLRGANVARINVTGASMHRTRVDAGYAGCFKGYIGTPDFVDGPSEADLEEALSSYETITGQAIRCGQCGHGRFRARRAMLNSRAT